MATIFSRIIDGELPGTFVWRDERCVAFLSINPLQRGHTLVVPIDEVDHWLDASPELSTHLFDVARRISVAISSAFAPEKVGLMIAGLEVPHLHIHLVPIFGVHDLDFANAATSVDPADLESAAGAIRVALHAAGENAVSAS
jgi:histidine triad (HIT) family protein